MPEAPANEAAEVPQPLPVTQRQDQSTEDYFRDDMAVFEIEGITFRVPKCLFEPGPGKFKPLLFEEGKDSSEDAIPLPDLTADEFRALIDFFLPYRCINRKEPSLQHWINLLSISTKYQLDSIRLVAIKGINTYSPEIDPVEKYALAKKYAVEEWEGSSFKILCQRPDPLTVEEATKLGVVVATEVFRERERIRSVPEPADETSSPRPVIGFKKPTDIQKTRKESPPTTFTSQPMFTFKQ